MTQKNPRGFRAWYGDLKLQSKFTLALTLIVVVPAILVAVFFYHQLYDMVVSNTIRKEQISSAKTAPLIEDTVDDVTAAYDDLASIPFFKTIFHNPVSTPMGYVTHGEQAEEFKEKVAKIAELAVGDACTGSNPRAIDPANMEKLLTCTYYGTEVDF